MPDVDPAFRADVLAGLAEPIPAVPARWLYDRRGSELFDAITRLPSYYPTRTETALLTRIMPELDGLCADNCVVVELGSGSSTKTPLLLRGIRPKAYVPVDISGDYLRESAARVDADFPGLEVHPVEADFTKPFALPEEVAGLPRLGFFPGSTIGNFVPRSGTDLLRHFRDILGTGARLLIGMDRVKPIERLIAAYDDREGVTAGGILGRGELTSRQGVDLRLRVGVAEAALGRRRRVHAEAVLGGEAAVRPHQPARARAVAEVPVEAAPMSRIGSEVEASVRSTMKGRPREEIEQAVRRALGDAAFRYILFLRLNAAALELADHEGLRAAAVFYWMGCLLGGPRENEVEPADWAEHQRQQAESWQTWRSAAARSWR
jgi:hypothetical protein